MLESIEEFRIIVSVYNTLSLSVSSEVFGVSPATMSKKLSAIERKLGKKLFYRSTREISPTEEGERYYRHAANILSAIDSFHHMEGLAAEPVGNIKISASTTFARLYLMPALNQFSQRYPRVNIELILSDQIVDIIKEGIDVAIRIAPLKDSSLISKRIGDGSKVLCASKSYIEQYGTPMTPQDLKQHNCLVLGNDNNWQFVRGKKTVSVKVRGNFKVNYGEMLVQAVSAGMGIAYLSLWHIHQQIKQGEIIPLLDDYEQKNQADIYLVYPNREQMPHQIRTFIDFLAAELQI